MGRAAKSSWIRGVINRVADFWDSEFPGEDASTLALFTGLAFLSRQLEQFHDRTLKPHGRVLSEYQTLAYLRTLGAASPTELNRILLQTPAGVTYTIDQLEKAKLVSRRPSASDRRSIQVALLPAGKREAEKLMKAELAAQHAVLARLGAAKLEKALAVVMALIDSFEPPDEAST